MSRSAVIALETLFIGFLLFVLLLNFSEFSVLRGRHQLALRPKQSTPKGSIVLNGLEIETPNPASTSEVKSNPAPDSDVPESLKNITGGVNNTGLPSSHEIERYIEDIFHPQNNTSRSGFGCKDSTSNRYNHLAPPSEAQSKPEYFFAVNLYDHRDTFSSLLNTVVQTIKFLGPSSTFLSIVSYNSKDDTAEILSALKPSLDALHISHSIVRTHNQSSSFLRNLTLSPLMTHPTAFSPKTTILFLDDTPFCSDDLLELLSTRATQSADLLCGMDYIDGGLRYYNSLRDLFWEDKAVRTQFVDKTPFQVFSCWGGAVAASARPFLEYGVRFREFGEGSKDYRRYGDEAVRLAAEMWENGFQRVAIAPSVSLASADKLGKQTLHEARRVKKARGYTAENVERSERRRRQDTAGTIQWRKELPNWALCEGDGNGDKQPVWDKGPVVPVTGCR